MGKSCMGGKRGGHWWYKGRVAFFFHMNSQLLFGSHFLNDCKSLSELFSRANNKQRLCNTFWFALWDPNLCAVSVLSATIVISLYEQSFYNSQHTPSVAAEGNSSPVFSLLRVPHPLICQQADTHRQCWPERWSITDGGLAIVIPFVQK